MDGTLERSDAGPRLRFVRVPAQLAPPRERAIEVPQQHAVAHQPSRGGMRQTPAQCSRGLKPSDS